MNKLTAIVIGFILSLAIHSVGVAQDERAALERETVAEVPGGCARPEKLAGICVDIYQKLEAPTGSPFDYEYERKVHEAACADPSKDSDEVMQRKIQHMWVKLEKDHLKCNQANFDVRRGHVLKYAVKMRNSDFISLTAQVWKVNLNAVDESDGWTVLDYVKKEMERTKGSSIESTMRAYYSILRKAGAKHKSEL